MVASRMILITALITLASFSAGANEIESFRCGNGIVEKGTKIANLKKICGSKWMPDEIQTRSYTYSTRAEKQDFLNGFKQGQTGRHWWGYRQYGQFTKWMWVVNGEVRLIEEGERN